MILKVLGGLSGCNAFPIHEVIGGCIGLFCRVVDVLLMLRLFS